MSNALEQASLIMVPSGYEDGTLGSLKPTDGTGDFTFSRGSDISATRVNADGYIEKGYENLLLQSNSFTTSPWSFIDVTLTGGQEGYDGSSNAWKAQFNSGFRYIGQNISSSGINTFSVYAKAGTTEWIRLSPFGTSSSVRIYFNIPLDGSGSVGFVSGDVETNIDYISNGWYKCSITIKESFTSLNIVGSNADNSTSTSGEYCYIQDAMLNQGLVAYPYIETTTTPVAGGILEDMPRLDYSSCPALLLEPQRTNLIEHSEYITSANNASISHNATESPEGELNAPIFTATTTDPFVRSSNISITTGTSYSISFYIKGFGTAIGKGCTTSVTNTGIETFTLTGSWQRITYTGTATATRTNAQLRIDAPNVGAVVGEQFSVWGMQVEQGSYPTSYIPTYGVSQTRLAESCVVNNATSSIGQTEGTIFLDFVYENNGGAFYGSYVANATGFTDFVGWRIPDDKTTLNILIRYNNVYQVLDDVASVFAVGNRYKVALKYSSGDIKVFVNNQEKYSSTATYTTPSVSLSKHTISGNTANAVDSLQQDTISKVNQSILFPTALTDSECIELTTI